MDKIYKVIDLMIEYQRDNNVKGCCLQNCQFLYDIVKNYSCINIKPKAVIVLYINDKTEAAVFHIHMVLEKHGTIIDPSYEILKIKKPIYCTSIKELTEIFKGQILSEPEKEDIKLTIKNFLDFIPFENKIMNNSEPIVTNLEFYHSQADYVENNYKLKKSVLNS